MDQANTSDNIIIDLELEHNVVISQNDIFDKNLSDLFVEKEPVTVNEPINIREPDTVNEFVTVNESVTVNEPINIKEQDTIKEPEITNVMSESDNSNTYSIKVNVLTDKMESEYNQQQIKKQNNLNNEYIIALRTNFLLNKLNCVIFNNDVVTRDVLDYFKKVRETLLDYEFVTKFKSYSEFDEYYQIINEAYDIHYQKLNQLYMLYEKNQCDEYITEIRDAINQDKNLKKIQEDWCNNIQESYEAYKSYIEKIYAKINAYINSMKISEDGGKYIINNIKPIFENIESNCNKIVHLNMEYIANCTEYTKKFSEKIDEYIENISLSGFDDEQDDIWNDLYDILENMYERYMSTYILYNIDKSAPPKKLRETYETEILQIYHDKWINKIDQIKINKNREYLNKLFACDHNFIEHCNNRVNKLTLDNWIQISDSDNLSMVKSEYLQIKKIIERCNIDIFYIGNIYMIRTKTTRFGKEHHVYKNNIMVNYIKQLCINYGIYTKENIPQFLVLNDHMIDKLFTVVNIGNNKLYIMTPQNFEMFSKFTELINGLRVKEEVEKYFNFDMADLVYSLTL